jgi:hypothetical protein
MDLVWDEWKGLEKQIGRKNRLSCVAAIEAGIVPNCVFM